MDKAIHSSALGLDCGIGGGCWNPDASFGKGPLMGQGTLEHPAARRPTILEGVWSVCVQLFGALCWHHWA